MSFAQQDFVQKRNKIKNLRLFGLFGGHPGRNKLGQS